MERDMMKCNIRTSTKMHEIRSTVENVSKLPEDFYVIGPDFYLAPECNCCISFRKKSLHLWIYICNKSNSDIKIKRTLVLLDCNSKKLHEERDDRIFSLEKDNNVDLMGNAKIDVNILKNDTLIIDICATIEEIVTKGILKQITHDIDAGLKLREDFKTMLENPINSDVSLHVDSERIAAHWSVLCSRSPYFKRMFDSQMEERVQNSVTITDISVSTLKNLIKFLYSAHFFDNDKSNDIEELFDLYYGADKYEVMDLKALCACKIKNSATVENVCKILLLAHRHNDEDLAREAMDFIHLNSEAVFQTDGWKKFKASEPLAAELCSFFCLKKN